MRRTLALLLVLAAPALADVGKEDIRKLVAAGVGDDVIVAFIRANRPVAKLSADDLIELKAAGVSEVVLKALVETPASAPTYAPSASGFTPRLPDRGDPIYTGYSSSTTYVAPAYAGYYDYAPRSYYSPSYSYYSPSWSIGWSWGGHHHHGHRWSSHWGHGHHWSHSHHHGGWKLGVRW